MALFLLLSDNTNIPDNCAIIVLKNKTSYVQEREE